MVDQMLEEYSTKFATHRWLVAVFCHLLDMAAPNAYTLHRALFPPHVPRDAMKRRVFLKMLGMKLCKPLLSIRFIPIPNPISDNVKQLAQPATKDGLAPTMSRLLT